MDNPEFVFQKNQRVRLRDGVDPGFYGGYGVPGNEGWIRNQQRDDKFQYPRVFIEWDKDHWSYNGAPDTWTWEGHFDSVEDNEPIMTDKDEETYREFQAFLEFKASQKKETSTEPVMTEHGLVLPDDPHRYIHTLQKAVESLTDAEAFVVIAVRRQEHPKAPSGMLIPMIYQDSRTPESELVCNMQVPGLGSKLYDMLALSILEGLTEERKNDEFSG